MLFRSDFDMHAKGASTPVKALVAGKTFARPQGGFVGVSNVGLGDNWFNNHLSQANLYAFGRLAWNPDLTSREISDEWTRLTFGANAAVNAVVSEIQLSSWRTFENYTGPLGLQTLTDITGNHYGVAVEASERNGWGQWHNADERGAGMDRSTKTGTGYAGQYRPEVARIYESPASTPDELLLFFHHVPYTQRLHSGKTVIQHLYDTHYEGAEAVANYVRRWKTLEGLVDERRYQEILAQLEYQSGQAEVWRDGLCIFQTLALNDVVLNRGGTSGMVEFRIEVDGHTDRGRHRLALDPHRYRIAHCLASSPPRIAALRRQPASPRTVHERFSPRAPEGPAPRSSRHPGAACGSCRHRPKAGATGAPRRPQRNRKCLGAWRPTDRKSTRLNSSHT